MNEQLSDKYELWSESRNLIQKAVYRMVNALRHISPQTANESELHILDSLIRGVEYLEDVKIYQYKIRKQLYHMDRTIRALKKKIKEDATIELTMPDRFWLYLQPSEKIRSIKTIHSSGERVSSGESTVPCMLCMAWSDWKPEWCENCFWLEQFRVVTKELQGNEDAK